MRSSAPLSKRSPNWVHPMPTMATRSLIPLLAIAAAPQYGSCLPEIVVDAVGSEQTAERHLHAVTHRQVLDLGVGELDGQTPAPVEVDDGEHDRGAGRVGDAVDSKGGDGALDVGHRHRAGGVGQRRELGLAALWAAPPDEAELPVLVAAG